MNKSSFRQATTAYTALSILLLLVAQAFLAPAAHAQNENCHTIDFDTGSIIDARIVDADSAGFADNSASYLTGFVDSVDEARGLAVVSGMTVDYTALLSRGSAPRVGDQVSISGREYSGLRMLVADPQMRLETR